MKKTILAAAFSVAMLPVFAQAADGTVTITGSVSAGTCVLTPTGGSQTVTMPNVVTSSLTTPETSSSTVTPVDIRLTGCGTTQPKVGVSVDGGINGDPVTGRLKNTTVEGGATNVQIAVVNRNTDENLKLPNGKVTVTAGATGEALIPLGLRYVATAGPATAGKLTTSMAFSVIYE